MPDIDYNPDEERYPDHLLYQLVVQHQDHGRTTEVFPVFDLGLFNVRDANHLANYLATVCHQQGHELFDDTVHNLVEAWGCMDYRCWLLPIGHNGVCLELNDDGVVEVPAANDPR